MISLIVLLASVAAAGAPVPKPKLVLTIMIDQFRPDYLQRFRPYFGRGGFNLFLERGANFAGARYEHAVTSTCPGHAVVLTGSYANVNGIVNNDWYDAAAGREVYCAADSLFKLIGVQKEGRSPRNLIGNTVGDELKLASAGRSRVIAVAGKDRSAIMMGGHLADAAYWTVDTLFVSSTYYLKDLPEWARRFNASGAMSAYSGKMWERLLPVARYDAIGADDVPGEEDVGARGRVFPHRLGEMAPSVSRFVTSLEYSPFHNDIVAEFAMKALAEEGLGRDSVPDLLAISFSAIDRVGHAYGPNSQEVMDIVIRTDRLLERLFAFVDKQVGLANTLIILSADHGVAPLPELMEALKPGAGKGHRVNPTAITAAINAHLDRRFGVLGAPGWVLYHEPPWIYLNLPALERRKISVQAAEREASVAVEKVTGVQQAITATELRLLNQLPESPAALSFHPARSGNIYYSMRPYWLAEAHETGASHGSPWSYDARVPLLWFGAGILPATYPGMAAIADVAPTLAYLLGISEPGGSRGRVLSEMFSQK
ncbi:MAG TPA: alkaline phosphatase family protein [Gemmatimonadales bacterium]